MPEAAIATSAASTSTAAPVTTSGDSSAEPKITYGSPEGDAVESGGDQTPQEHTNAAEEAELSDEFGELDAFGDEEASDFTAQPEKFTSEQYKALKQALAANPELFKAVKREISENSRYKQVFDSPEAAREVTEKLESLGGLESIEQESQEWSKVFEMFSKGDPGVIDYWAKDNPQALSKLFPHVYDRMATENPAIWAHKAAGTFMATMQQQGIVTALNALAASEAVKKSPQDAALINQIVEAINRVNKVAEQAPTQDLTPEAKALSEKEISIKAQERDLYQRGVSQKIAPLISKAAMNALGAVIKGRKLSAEAKKDLLRDITFDYAVLAKKDDNFQKNAKALLGAGETEKFVKLVNSMLARTMPLAARRTWRKYAGISGLSASEAAQRKTEGQSRRESGGGGAVTNVVAGPAPKSGDIDWAKMRLEFGKDVEDVFMFGKKGVYGGKRVYFKKGDKTAYTY